MKIRKMNKPDNAGVTTILVVCVMAVIMALSLGIFLTASVMMKNSGRTLSGEQCRVMAVTLGDEIEKMLTSDQYDYPDKVAEDAGRAGNLAGVSMWHYVRSNIGDGSWPYLDESGSLIHGADSAVRTFQMEKEGTTGEIADIVLSLYWLCKKGTEIPDQLVVETTVTVKEQSCSITDVYTLQRNGTGDYDKWIWEHTERK